MLLLYVCVEFPPGDVWRLAVAVRRRGVGAVLRRCSPPPRRRCSRCRWRPHGLCHVIPQPAVRWLGGGAVFFLLSPPRLGT